MVLLRDGTLQSFCLGMNPVSSTGMLCTGSGNHLLLLQIRPLQNDDKKKTCPQGCGKDKWVNKYQRIRTMAL